MKPIIKRMIQSRSIINYEDLDFSEELSDIIRQEKEELKVINDYDNYY